MNCLYLNLRRISMKKRIISCLCTLAIIMSLGTAPAFASASIQPYSASAPFLFQLTRGGGSGSTGAAYKSDYTAQADLFATGGGYMAPSGDIINFRLHDGARLNAGDLRSISSIPAPSYDLGVTYWAPTPGYFYLYASAGSSNYSQGVNIAGQWYP
jgi:hypothetical protein